MAVSGHDLDPEPLGDAAVIGQRLEPGGMRVRHVEGHAGDVQQIAGREPAHLLGKVVDRVEDDPFSQQTAGIPRRPSSTAQAMPVGPAPTMATRGRAAHRAAAGARSSSIDWSTPARMTKRSLRRLATSVVGSAATDEQVGGLALLEGARDLLDAHGEAAAAGRRHEDLHRRQTRPPASPPSRAYTDGPWSVSGLPASVPIAIGIPAWKRAQVLRHPMAVRARRGASPSRRAGRSPSGGSVTLSFDLAERRSIDAAVGIVHRRRAAVRRPGPERRYPPKTVSVGQ